MSIISMIISMIIFVIIYSSSHFASRSFVLNQPPRPSLPGSRARLVIGWATISRLVCISRRTRSPHFSPTRGATSPRTTTWATWDTPKMTTVPTSRHATSNPSRRVAMCPPASLASRLSPLARLSSNCPPRRRPTPRPQRRLSRLSRKASLRRCKPCSRGEAARAWSSATTAASAAVAATAAVPAGAAVPAAAPRLNGVARTAVAAHRPGPP